MAPSGLLAEVNSPVVKHLAADSFAAALEPAVVAGAPAGLPSRPIEMPRPHFSYDLVVSLQRLTI
jgi:hypothetical protein